MHAEAVLYILPTSQFCFYFFFKYCFSFFSLSLFIFQKSIRNPYVDIFVAIITVPTLILLALLLDANLQDNFGSDSTTIESKSSFIVLIFGFGFLVLSLLVCGCIVHKMGLCLWKSTVYTDTGNDVHNSVGQNITNANGTRANDYAHIIDMPPSYETVINGYKLDMPFTSESPALIPTTQSTPAALFPPPPTYESICREKHTIYEISGETSNHI